MKHFLSLIFFLLFSSNLFANAGIAGRQVFILYPGLDSVWGSYLFMVSNPAQYPANASFKVMLPEETLDFEVQQGLVPDDVKLGEDGGLNVNKEFPPGDTLVTIGFKVPSFGGESPLTIKPLTEIPSLSFFVSKNSLEVRGVGLDFLPDQYFSGKNYDTYTVASLAAGSSYNVLVKGSPEGRYNFWLMGAVVGVILLLLLIYSFFTKPSVK